MVLMPYCNHASQFWEYMRFLPHFNFFVTTYWRWQVNMWINQPMEFFDHHGSTGLINRLSDDASVIADATTKQLAQGLGSIFTLGLFTYNMITLSPTLSTVGFCIVTPLACLILLLGLGLRSLRVEVQSRESASMQIAQERIAAVATVRAFSQESSEVSQFSDKCDWVLAIKKNATLVHALYHSGVELSNGVIVAGVMFWGASLLHQGTISPGKLATFILYARAVGTALKEISYFYTNLSKGVAASERIQEVIESTPGEDNDNESRSGGDSTRTLESVEGNIRFHSVSFAYPSRQDCLVLSEINMEIPARGVFAIFGASGCGKSTMAKLMLRFYDVKEGNGMIKLDGVNIRLLESKWLRRQIGYVSQNPVLFSGSIRENIMYGLGSDESTTSSEDQMDSLLYKTAKDANALEFILRLPNKFDTLVGERGLLLSGGQIQRIAIARSLIKNPKVLLFDEATSALDSENEQLIQEALDRVGQNRTVIIIAHRLSTIRNAAKIAEIADGKVSAVGTYSDLLDLPFGKFKKLAEGQTE